MANTTPTTSRRDKVMKRVTGSTAGASLILFAGAAITPAAAHDGLTFWEAIQRTNPGYWFERWFN